MSTPKPLLQSPQVTQSPSPIMWRTVARNAAVLRSPKKSLGFNYRPCSFLGVPEDLRLGSRKSLVFFYKGILRNVKVADSLSGRPGFGFYPKGYASLAEAVVSMTDAEEEVSVVVEEVEELLAEMRKEERRDRQFYNKRRVAADRGMGTARYNALRRRQMRVECEAWEQAVKEYKELMQDMCAQKLAPNLPYMKSLFLGWFEPLRDAIAEEQELFWEGKKKTAYSPYFDQLPADMMAVITMHKMVALLMTGGGHGSARVVQAACTIGDAVEQEIRIHHFLEKTKRKRRGKGNPEAGGGSSNELSVNPDKLRFKISNLLRKHNLPAVKQLVKGHDGLKSWSQEAKAKVGSRLIELLIQKAYIQSSTNQLCQDPPDIRPAFSHTFKTFTKDAKGRPAYVYAILPLRLIAKRILAIRFVLISTDLDLHGYGRLKQFKVTLMSAGRRYGVIECDPAILKGVERTPRHMVIPYMPMLIPPIKWTAYDKGAYLVLHSTVMRTHGVKQQREAVNRTPQEQVKSVFEALDILGATRWKVNKRVLSVVDRIWNSGGHLAGLVDRSDLSLPIKPETDDELLVKKWKWKVKGVKKENMERHSQRCDIELKLAVARKMKEEEGFYYPHNLDFRGRAYPMHPYLNHLGSDLCRGILEFANGRPLGNSGLRWLKIHVANLFAGGVDKLSLEARVAFTENHLDDIFDSADRPLEGKRWWLSAEDPFQCLAVCINLTEALRSPSPETFLSHVPVHQDGSCNGLQHYAALGRDKLGAAAVNLVAGEKPADVYSGIAARVLDIMRRDAQKDPEVFPDALHARALVNQVNRKLVKQTVMTSVYGVTYIGARDQIKRRLKERGAILDDSEIFGASCYAAKVTLTALGEMFEAARSIMSWLGECAKIIASQNQPVRWTTPLGLPVVQPYRRLGRHLVKTSLQILTLQRDTDKVLVRRQRTAFPPNFVHSLDGSHMMMTAVACKKAGLTFAGVHDSYWTHAGDIDVMSRILREKFVELYEIPILENLLESFEQSFPLLSFPPLPDRGDFDLKDVLESPYFFN